MVCLALMLPVAAWSAPSMRVDGTEIRVIDADGKAIAPSDLSGSELDLGDTGILRIEQIAQDPTARFPEETWLMKTELKPPGAAEFSNLCPADPTGDKRMMIYSGYLDKGLRYVADTARFSLSCVSGVEAKCLRWGYLPWRKSPVGEVSLAPYFETCIRMARADYCGNDQTTTRDGTSIDMYDRVGVQQATPGLKGYDFEAGWGPKGAICVDHARIPEKFDLAKLPKLCARLTTADIGESCTEASAEARGALMFNLSVDRTTAGK